MSSEWLKQWSSETSVRELFQLQESLSYGGCSEGTVEVEQKPLDAALLQVEPKTGRRLGIRWDEIEAHLPNSWNHSAFKKSWRLRWFDKRDEFWWNEVALKNRCNPIIRSRIFSSIPCAGHRHQIRVHLASCGHPILGDDAYHGQPWGIRGTCHRTLGRWNGEGFSDLCNLVVGRWRSCWIEVIILE